MERNTPHHVTQAEQDALIETTVAVAEEAPVEQEATEAEVAAEVVIEEGQPTPEFIDFSAIEPAAGPAVLSESSALTPPQLVPASIERDEELGAERDARSDVISDVPAIAPAVAQIPFFAQVANRADLPPRIIRVALRQLREEAPVQQEPAPQPQPTPDPEPQPEPTPDPEPQPEPEPTPEPTPEPAPQPELIRGTERADVLTGGKAWERIEGLNGNDTIDPGNSNADQLVGGRGSDIYIGHHGKWSEIRDEQGSNDVLRAEGRTDIDLKLEDGFSGDVSGLERISKGADVDTLDIIARNNNTAVDWDFNGVNMSAVDEIRGSNMDDEIHGGNSAEVIDGGKGDDILHGGEGSDVLRGNSGVDQLNGGGGNDRLDGGNTNGDILDGGRGSDIFLARHDKAWHYDDEQGSNDVILAEGRSNFRVKLYDGFSGEDSGIERISAGDDVNDLDVVAQSNNVAVDWDFSGVNMNDVDEIRGSNLDDEIRGGNSAETINGGKGNDILHGGEGSDVLLGHSGVDQLNGGGGNDRLDAGNTNGDILDGGGGSDIFLARHNKAWQYNDEQGSNDVILAEGRSNFNIKLYDGFNGDDSGIERISAGDDVNNLDVIAQSNNTAVNWDFSDVNMNDVDEIHGSHKADTIIGSNGHDVIEGEKGNDILVGGNGNDQLFGEAGDDMLLWDRGDSVIDGGSGFDTVVAENRSLNVDLDSGVFANVEAFDVTNNRNDDLTINASDVLDLSDDRRLVIEGDAGDEISSVDFVDRGANEVLGDTTFATFSSGRADLWVELGLELNGVVLV